MALLLAILLGTGVWAQDGRVGSRVCGGCHSEIFRTYMATGMSRSSGTVGSGGFVEKFSESSIGSLYRVEPSREAYRMRFERGNVSGVRNLRWFIGSGAVGRSYA